MGELAATLVDTLLPALPYRQWVFTYPHALRRRWRKSRGC